MTDRQAADPLMAAREAAAGGDWERALALFMEVDADDRLADSDLPMLAEVAYAAGHLDLTITAWERAYAAALAAGDDDSAAGAAARVAMHLLFDTALLAPVRGWLARCLRLLDGRPESAAEAWCAVVQAYERLLAGDLDGARPWAARAVDVGSRVDPAACAIGRVADARIRILDGDVEEGLAQLDEVGVAVVAGDLDPLSTGVVYCELVCALQGVAQYDLAEQWTEAMERWCQTNAIGSLHGRCRVHRAEILRLRGHLEEAEAEVDAACDELRPYLRRELGWPLTELGTIKLQSGDLLGAEQALLAAHHAGWEAQPGLALLCLATGDTPAAARGLREALERPVGIPSKERPPDGSLQRAPLLAAQVEVEVVAGDLDRARAAAGELARDRRSVPEQGSGGWGPSGPRQGAPGRGGSRGSPARLHGGRAALERGRRPVRSGPGRRLGRAGCLRAAGDDQRADLEEVSARAVIGAAAPVAAVLPSVGAADGATFGWVGDHWHVAFDGATATIADRKGMRHLARLLADPGRELHVLDLMAMEESPSEVRDAARASDAGEHLDDEAKRAYRRRLIDIDEDIEEAVAVGDDERAARAESEREFLLRELSRAFGLGGRGRRAGATSERARVAVTRAVRQAMARIAERHPALGAHLERAIRTGTYCAYLPDPRFTPSWSVDLPGQAGS